VNRVWRQGQFDSLNIHLLVGCQSVYFAGNKIHDYNSALLIDPHGAVADRYHKMHPVMFGEYVPFGNVVPWLYRLTPLRQGLTRGTTARAFEIQGVRLAPSVCFESTVPHLIRRHVRQLERQGAPPDALVNVTDDGWFWGSSILDLQLACAVFRAVELRRPFLVAANTGISAWISSEGRILARGPRRAKDVLLAEIGPCHGQSLYCLWGDWAAVCCLLVCLALAATPIVERLTRAPTHRAVPASGHFHRTQLAASDSDTGSD
jgi:apolipoprotein N-acyltransferase